MLDLQQQIMDISKAHIDSKGLEGLARSIKSGLSSLNPDNWLHFLISIIVIGGMVMLLILFLPVIIRSLTKALYTVQCDLQELRLGNKKGRDAKAPLVQSE